MTFKTKETPQHTETVFINIKVNIISKLHLPYFFSYKMHDLGQSIANPFVRLLNGAKSQLSLWSIMLSLMLAPFCSNGESIEIEGHETLNLGKYISCNSTENSVCTVVYYTMGDKAERSMGNKQGRTQEDTLCTFDSRSPSHHTLRLLHDDIRLHSMLIYTLHRKQVLDGFSSSWCLGGPSAWWNMTRPRPRPKLKVVMRSLVPLTDAAVSDHLVAVVAFLFVVGLHYSVTTDPLQIWGVVHGLEWTKLKNKTVFIEFKTYDGLWGLLGFS